MEWTTNAEPSYFLTLTYDDEHLPRTSDGVPTLQRSRFVNWVKNTGLPKAGLRYYAVGEYGDLSQRPHYHMAVFPRFGSQVSELTRQWQGGFTSAFELNPQRALYLAQYTTKKLTVYPHECALGDKEPEFRTSSRGPALGAAFVSVLVQAYGTTSGRRIISERGDIERSVRFGQKILPIPRFILGKVRESLGIPRLHEERLAHDGYYKLHCEEENAEWKPDEALREEMKYYAKKKALSLRGQKI